ncbi:hypothetical protein TcYC6_0087220 [Trypanosoma cruzi]|nr:hypothetical protein TcYC6_0087220 [Trypanosoma cruzi]
MGRAHPTAAPHFAERPTKLLFSFCLPYRAWRPLEERCDGVDCQAAEEAVAALDVLRIFFAFQDYCREEDISCLLHVQESKWRDRSCGIALHEGLRSLIASTVRSVCFRPLPKHPAVFLPVNGKIHRHAEGVAEDVAARNALKALRSGSAACKDPAALGILLALTFCCLLVGAVCRRVYWPVRKRQCLCFCVWPHSA